MSPVLVVIAGPNGSGKTTLTEQVLLHRWLDGCEYINPDMIAQNEFGDWNSKESIYKAANVAAARREQCLTQRKSLVFETVLSSPDKIEFVKKAKSAGFFIRVFFVGTSHPSINAARVAQRVMEGGHDVPIPKIISRYSRSIANCSVLARIADRCYVYDNSECGVTPRLMFKTKNGVLVKAYSTINDWAKNILDFDASSSFIEQQNPKSKLNSDTPGLG